MIKLLRRLLHCELLHRLRSPTPAFWRKVQVRGLVTGATLAATAALPGLHPLLSSITLHAAFACGIAVAVAQAACDSPPPSIDQPAL